MRDQAAPASRVAEQVGFSDNNFLHLFDEHWFFNNVLSGIRITPNHVRLKDADFATSKLYIQEPAVLSLEAPLQQANNLSPSKSMGRKKSPRTEILLQWFANARLAMAWEASYRRDFRNKKWRSLGDLETMELQGFKDLGFVFDGERKEKEDDGRIYLPETWFTQKSMPVMVLQQVRCRSGEEMKEQLRFWARAVACNVWGR